MKNKIGFFLILSVFIVPSAFGFKRGGLTKNGQMSGASSYPAGSISCRLDPRSKKSFSSDSVFPTSVGSVSAVRSAQ